MPEFRIEPTEADREIEYLRSRLKTARTLLRGSLEILDSARVTSLGIKETRGLVRQIKDALKERP